jgi:NAD(P)-dependent dehydrogenase (short-subunit alcohol dehydrogenase family)
VKEIQAESGEATSVGAVVSRFDQVKAVADCAVEEYGRLDSWVHLAAVGLFATSQQTTPEEFERVIDVNLMGQVYGAMAALPHIKLEGRGALIHISSVEAKRSFRGAARAVISSQALSPRLLDAVLERVGFGVRYTPKPDDALDNLFGPIAGHNTSEDSFSDQAHPKILQLAGARPGGQTGRPHGHRPGNP